MSKSSNKQIENEREEMGKQMDNLRQKIFTLNCSINRSWVNSFAIVLIEKENIYIKLLYLSTSGKILG